MKSVDSDHKIGNIAGVGDRRDEDIMECARIAAHMLDQIIIRKEKHVRGRTEKEVIELILKGINSMDKQITYEIIPLEIDATKHAVSIAKEGTSINALSDVINKAIEVVQQHLDLELEV